MNSRPCRAASVALSRLSRALSPRIRRISSPLVGATNSATAAPVIAPRRKDTTMVPAAPASSLAMSRAPLLEDADPDVEVLLWILTDFADERAQLARGGIHVLI